MGVLLPLPGPGVGSGVVCGFVARLPQGPPVVNTASRGPDVGLRDGPLGLPLPGQGAEASRACGGRHGALGRGEE